MLYPGEPPLDRTSAIESVGFASCTTDINGNIGAYNHVTNLLRINTITQAGDPFTNSGTRDYTLHPINGAAFIGVGSDLAGSGKNVDLGIYAPITAGSWGIDQGLHPIVTGIVA